MSMATNINTVAQTRGLTITYLFLKDYGSDNWVQIILMECLAWMELNNLRAMKKMEG